MDKPDLSLVPTEELIAECKGRCFSFLFGAIMPGETPDKCEIFTDTHWTPGRTSLELLGIAKILADEAILEVENCYEDDEEDSEDDSDAFSAEDEEDD